jgi:hypothetical protein
VLETNLALNTPHSTWYPGQLPDAVALAANRLYSKRNSH